MCFIGDLVDCWCFYFLHNTFDIEGMFTQGSTDPAIQNSAMLIMIHFEPLVREMDMQDKHMSGDGVI